MPLADMLAGATQRDVVEHNTVLTYLSRFTYNYPGTMIAKIPFTYLRSGMNFKTGEKPADLRQQTGYKRQSQIPQEMDEPVKRYCLESGVQQEFNIPAGRVIAISCLDVFK